MSDTPRKLDFIRELVEADNASGRFGGRVQTRFPPEPNGYAHIGHCKAICVDYGIARDYDGVCFLRLDDTNPTTEDMEFVEAMKRDVEWLGFEVGDRIRFASDYFDQIYAFAERMVEEGRAYVDSSSEAEIRECRGTVTEAGRPTAYRDRSVAENLDLLRRMKAGEFPDGAHVLRFKGDLAASNMKLRDPLMYRIRHAHHFRTGDAWCIYPMYDWAHGLSDAIEGVTHSICTLEFQDNRALYDLFVDAVGFAEPPYQTEMARLAITHVHLSKRKLIALVDEGHVRGWDDPRMPTLAGYRRRGVRPEALVKFVEDAGIAKTNATVEIQVLEGAIRDDLDPLVPRVMAVLDPLPLVLDNWGEEEVDVLEAPLYPHDVPLEGSRAVSFGKTILLDRSDFAETPPKKWKRLTVGGEVRLRYAYIVRCTGVERDADGNVVALRGTVDRDSRGGRPKDGRKIPGTLQWVSAAHGLPAEVRLYDHLYGVPHPGAAEDWRSELNPESEVVKQAVIEPFIAEGPAGSRYQFERLGYFSRDIVDGVDALVYNRIVPLKDTFARKPPAPAPAASKKPAPAPAPAARTVAPAAQALADAHGMSTDDAGVLVEDAALMRFFEEATAAGGDGKGVAALLVNELRGRLDGADPADSRVTPAALADVARLQADGTINSTVARDLMVVLVEEGGDPSAIVRARGWAAITDPAALEALVDGVLDQHPDELAAFRGGKTKLQGFFVGQVMRASGGKADPQALKQVLFAKLRS